MLGVLNRIALQGAVLDETISRASDLLSHPDGGCCDILGCCLDARTAGESAALVMQTELAVMVQEVTHFRRRARGYSRLLRTANAAMGGPTKPCLLCSEAAEPGGGLDSTLINVKE